MVGHPNNYDSSEDYEDAIREDQARDVDRKDHQEQLEDEADDDTESEG